jgi:hypothetical protein
MIALSIALYPAGCRAGAHPRYVQTACADAAVTDDLLRQPL